MSSGTRLIRSQPLTCFADAARANEGSLVRAFLVSPWIVARDGREFPAFARLIATLRASEARVTVLTRAPDKAGHLEAIRLLSTLAQVEILFLDNLHAKLYLLECNMLRIAMLGSPNFTLEGDREWRELAVEIRSTRESDAAALLVRDLFGYALDLISDEGARVHKRLTVGRR
jgi:hypothetical protein